MEEVDKLTVIQMARLSDWLKTKGMTAEDFDECVHYISNGKSPDQNGEKNQASENLNETEA